MSVTTTYSRLHRQLIDLSRPSGLVPFDIRLLVALQERGGVGATDELQAELCCDGTAIRRSSLALRAAALVKADASDGGRPRRGLRTTLTLTQRGAALTAAALEEVG